MEAKVKLVKVWLCRKCGYQWANRKGKKPVVCPSCHKYTWDDDVVDEASDK